MTVPYVVYTSDGTILRRGYCTEKDLPLQVRSEGEHASRVESIDNVDDTTCKFNARTGKVEESPSRAAETRRLASQREESRLLRRDAMRTRLRQDPTAVVAALQHLATLGLLDGME